MSSDQLYSFFAAIYVLFTFQLILLRITAPLSKTAYERGHGGGVELLAALQQPEELPADSVHAVEDGQLVVYCTVLCCTVLYCTVLYCTAPGSGCGW